MKILCKDDGVSRPFRSHEARTFRFARAQGERGEEKFIY